MNEIVTRYFTPSFQTILIKLILTLFIIFFELSLSQIDFFYYNSPLIFFTLLPFVIYFLICLSFDIICRNHLGFFTFSMLCIVLLLNFTNIEQFKSSYLRKLLIFASLLFIFQTIQILIFFMLYFTFPALETIVFQYIFTMICYPIVMFFLRPIKNLINLISVQL
jgi:hypothetical protein